MCKPKIPSICLAISFHAADKFDAMSCLHSINHKSIISIANDHKSLNNDISMISTTSAIHHILALGGVDSSIIISGTDTKSTIDQRLATTTNDDAIAMESADEKSCDAKMRQTQNEPGNYYGLRKSSY